MSPLSRLMCAWKQLGAAFLVSFGGPAVAIYWLHHRKWPFDQGCFEQARICP